MSRLEVRVRRGAESNDTRVEVLMPYGLPRFDDFRRTLERMKIRCVSSVETFTPQHRSVLAKVTEEDGSELSQNRIVDLVQAMRGLRLAAQRDNSQLSAGL